MTTKMRVKNGFAVFSDERNRTITDVNLRLITTHQDIALWADHLGQKAWFTDDLRNRFETECIRHMNRI